MPGQEVQFGGSTVAVGRRYSGPPSLMYPLIRDLADSDALLEIDTKSDRIVGKPDSIKPGRVRPVGRRMERAPETLVVLSTPRPESKLRPLKHEAPFDEILAVRVLEAPGS